MIIHFMSWYSAFLWTGLGMGLGIIFKPTFQTLCTLFQTFQRQHCVNTVFPQSIEPYIPKRILNTIEMGKFIYEYVWIKFEQKLCHTCVEYKGLFHVRCIIQNKMYTIILKPEKGPGSQCTFKNEEGLDCTLNVLSYLRGARAIVQVVDPGKLGYSGLVQSLNDKVISRFHRTEPLVRRD